MGANENESRRPKQWHKKTTSELKKMTPQQRAKYMAYEEPTKEQQDVMDSTLKRIRDNKSKAKLLNPQLTSQEEIDKQKHSALIGQLKAAEARNRIRVMRLQFQAMRAHEVKHLIACQPTSLKALRFEALVPPYTDNSNPDDQLDKMQRARVEALLEDDLGLTINRKLE